MLMTLLQRLGLLDDFLDTANHVERLLRQMIVFASTDALEALDRVLEGNVLAWGTGEDFGDVEGLGEETLDLAGARNGPACLPVTVRPYPEWR
jgi:hypothetical protein